MQHWKEGGHDQLCKKIKKGGGAEQYHADKKYEEAVADAVEECAEDTISVGNLTEILIAAREFEEAQSLAREKLPEIIDRHGPDDILTLEVRTWYARALFLEGEDLSEAENVLEDVWRRSKRVLSDSHPDTERARKFLEDVRSARADAAEES